MEIYFASHLLASSALYQGPSGLRVSAARLVQEAQALRAVQSRFFDRGNLQQSITFTSLRSFNSLREAEKFALLHAGALPGSGTAVFRVGEGADVEDLTLTGAVLSALPEITASGTSVRTAYTLAGGIPSQGAPILLETYADMIRRATIPIANAAQQVAVTFSSPFPSAPNSCNANVVKLNSGDPDVFVLGLVGLPTAAGFTARLSAPVPNANYRLTYNAIA